MWRMLAGRRDLRLVLSAGIISMTGDWILTIGLIYAVYAATGSTVASALAMASAFAPQMLLGAVAGVFADRWDRKRTMIVADLLLAAGLLPLLLVHGAAASSPRSAASSPSRWSTRPASSPPPLCSA
jgi:MFS family permease